MNTIQLAQTTAEIPFRLLDSLRQVPQEQFLAPSLSGGRSLRDVLVHMLIAEQNWVGHVVLKSEKSPAQLQDFASVDEIERAWHLVREETMRFLRAATAEQLSTTIVDEYEPHITYSAELALWHWLTHEFFHAGEICLALGLRGIQSFVPEIIS